MRGTRGLLTAWSTADEGASALIIAIVMIVLLGISAVVVDVGSLYTERTKLQTAADAAALAAVHDLPDMTLARARVSTYVTSNAPEAEVTSIAFYSGSTYISADAGTPAPVRVADATEPDVPELVPACHTEPIQQSGNPDTVQVSVSDPNAPLYFARIWKESSTPVSASATARVTSLAMTGVIPFAVVAASASDPDFGFVVGQTRSLQEGSGPGNYGWLTLNNPPVQDPGNNDKWNDSDFESVMEAGGTSYPVYLTQYPDVTGEKTPYMRAFQDWYTRGNSDAVMPVIVGSGPGSSQSVTVVGFARMHLTAEPQKNNVQAIFEGPVDQSDMTLAPFWPYSSLQHYALID